MTDENITQEGRFAGKVAIITGASSGIGRATAELLASEGAFVTITGRREHKLKEVQQLIGSSKVHIVVGDLADEEVQEKTIQETVDKFGGIDILVNNAGAFCPDDVGVEGLLEQSVQHFDYVMRLNVRTPLSLSKLAYPHLKESKGSIINVSSIVAKNFAAKSYPYYSVSKAALDQLTRSMAVEFADAGIRVNCVNPGLTSTDFFEKQSCTTEACRKAESCFVNRPDVIPLRRVATAQEIGNAIAFLADDKVSSYMIGQTLVVDGGASIQMPMLASSFHDFYIKNNNHASQTQT